MLRIFQWAATAAFLMCPAVSQAMSLDQAIREAVSTNPRIGEAAANRRAVDLEVRQAQGGLLPQVRLYGEAGFERGRRFDSIPSAKDDDWRRGGEGGVVVRQLLFDGGATINEIYRQMARSDAAAWRTFERAELTALDTIEAFVDIIRYSESLAAARRNIQVHRDLGQNVESRFEGGRAGVGDREQVRERLEAALAIEAELKIRLEEANAAFRRTVGKEPLALKSPPRIGGLPANKKEALELTLKSNPTLLASHSDVTASQRAYDAALGPMLPTVALEGRASSGRNSSERTGRFDDATAKIALSWDVFDGGTRAARRSELSERVTEQQLRLDALRRSAFESVDRAWAARANSGARVTSLVAQVAAAETVVKAYRSEYELGQRTLLDLLNAENGIFNAKLSLASARMVAVFADYQLLATSGRLLSRLNITPPEESRLRAEQQRNLFPDIFASPLR